MPRRLAMIRARSRRALRRGVATVELAICLPMLFLLVVGAIECSNLIFLQQAMTVAAYESAHVAARVGGLDANAQRRAQEILAARSIAGATVAFLPEHPESTPRGQMIRVTVSAPVASNSIGLDWLFEDRTVSASVNMVKN